VAALLLRAATLAVVAVAIALAVNHPRRDDHANADVPPAAVLVDPFGLIPFGLFGKTAFLAERAASEDAPVPASPPAWAQRIMSMTISVVAMKATSPPSNPKPESM
jgi:hypothetical protein